MGVQSTIGLSNQVKARLMKVLSSSLLFSKLAGAWELTLIQETEQSLEAHVKGTLWPRPVSGICRQKWHWLAFSHMTILNFKGGWKWSPNACLGRKKWPWWTAGQTLPQSHGQSRVKELLRQSLFPGTERDEGIHLSSPFSLFKAWCTHLVTATWWVDLFWLLYLELTFLCHWEAYHPLEPQRWWSDISSARTWNTALITPIHECSALVLNLSEFFLLS